MEQNKSLFVEFFGDYPLVRVMDFLIENDEFDYCRKDICDYADVSWNTLEKFWKRLEKIKIISFTRKVGKARLYRLNRSNKTVQKLIELDNTLLKQSLGSIGNGAKKQLARETVGTARPH